MTVGVFTIAAMMDGGTVMEKPLMMMNMTDLIASRQFFNIFSLFLVSQTVVRDISLKKLYGFVSFYKNKKLRTIIFCSTRKKRKKFREFSGRCIRKRYIC